MTTDPRLILGKVPLFADLSEIELDAICKRVTRRALLGGELLFAEGDDCQGLFVIESGAVRIFKSSPSGREQVLAIERPGGIVAELPVFDDGPYPACGRGGRRDDGAVPFEG